MKFETKTIATLLSSTALAMTVGMGSVHAEDTNPKHGEPGDGATAPEHPQGEGVAPNTGMGGALRDEEVQGHDTSEPAGVGQQQSDQPEAGGGDGMDHDDEDKDAGGM
ncbi:hypothetical protein D5687_10525 [Guyparkeria sp. SCN-R1]|uniref:hypothetical protein n=1 Tax=Guyparkeria sp. SCN-R1 TaxID=2341113 RepID=UPI000F6559CD|nr:hypothetical protein [Guyparkeria sp. SCN-R1]RRQ20198.1 hypothetical protein D5687_10525 [Guyparkeria sp. SCN-R1]